MILGEMRAELPNCVRTEREEEIALQRIQKTRKLLQYLVEL